MGIRYTKIPAEFFAANRKKLADLLEKKSVAIFHSADQMPRNGDCFYPFRQNSDFFYLTGIDQEQSVLLLYPDSEKEENREILFVRKTDAHIQVWEGHKYSIKEAQKVSGIKNVKWLGELDKVLDKIKGEVKNLYLNANENDRAIKEVESRDERLAKQHQVVFKKASVQRVAPLLQKLRMIKSETEIELLSNACEITNQAFRRVLSFVKPGVWEYEIEAEISHEFIRNRANGHAYSPIIASGANACILHYNDNNKKCKAGDLVLMDFGAEYANYAADLTRTIPVSGKFTPRQKQVYEAVLRVLKFAKSRLIQGNVLKDYQKEVCAVMEKELVDLKLLTLKDIKKQDPKNPLYRQYFMHGTSHFLGLDVHDVGDRSEQFKVGMVFTCEPGIYIPQEKIGIRLENDILITKKGPQDLMANIPIEIEEIESLMNGIN